jgi:hypothetical protein
MQSVAQHFNHGLACAPLYKDKSCLATGTTIVESNGRKLKLISHIDISKRLLKIQSTHIPARKLARVVKVLPYEM